MAALEAVVGPVCVALSGIGPHELIETWTGVIDDLLSATDEFS